MKITKAQLKQIIKEELSNFDNLNEMASSELETAQQKLADAEEKVRRLEASDDRFAALELTSARMHVKTLQALVDQIKRRS